MAPAGDSPRPGQARPGSCQRHGRRPSFAQLGPPAEPDPQAPEGFRIRSVRRDQPYGAPPADPHGEDDGSAQNSGPGKEFRLGNLAILAIDLEFAMPAQAERRHLRRLSRVDPRPPQERTREKKKAHRDPSQGESGEHDPGCRKHIGDGNGGGKPPGGSEPDLAGKMQGRADAGLRPGGKPGFRSFRRIRSCS